jgi:NAD(P)-dependent dehydrogenase (short-subunit alcohol dehydrogenase family)
MQRFGSKYKALVIGSSGGIGQSFMDQLKSDTACAKVTGISRQSSPPLHLEDENSIAQAANSLKQEGPFDLILVSTGILHSPNISPEKKLSDLNLNQLQVVFQINTFGPAMVLRYFTPLLSKNNSAMVILSAKVGSIEDNRLGGWYSYRASKAALNMLIKTTAIETARTNPNASFIALHPGTVCTALSEPFGGKTKGQTPDQAVRQMLNAIDQCTPNTQASFLAYDGHILPW